MMHWIKRIGFTIGAGFVVGATVFGTFEVFEWIVGHPATAIDVALGVGGGAALAAWNA